MAYMECHVFSQVLQHNIAVNVIVPTPEGNEQITDREVQKKYCYEKGLPVLYLLHGAYGDHSSWMRNSNIERYIQQYCCIAVMASVENSFYQDMAYGNAYYTFMTEELPTFVTNVFPASKKREDTYIAGFSMGGYGAWYLALSKPNQYAKAASMSGALDIASCYQQCVNHMIEGPFPWNCIFKDPTKLKGSNVDLMQLFIEDRKNGVLPELYHACGTSDFLIETNREVHQKLQEMGVRVPYHETQDMMHNWDYWDKEIQNILKWMFSQNQS